ncbi:MAG: hypothetical protein WDO16_08795 [Bacteroidota bacterium]
MRYVYFILLLLPVCVSAQDECGLKKTIDPYTKEVKLSTGLISLQGTSLSVEADSKEVDFSLPWTVMRNVLMTLPSR